MKQLPPPIPLTVGASALDQIPESCRDLVTDLVASASYPDAIFRELIAPGLASLTEQVRPWSHGQLNYSSTEAWRTAYEKVLSSPEIAEYRSVAWVKSESYWQDLPGQQGMKLNYALLDSGMRIQRILILGWNLWPPHMQLPLKCILWWIDEQHYRGVTLLLVRENDLAGEPSLLRDFGIYGDRATGEQEIDSDSRTVQFTLSFNRAAVELATDRWARLALFAAPYSELLDRSVAK
jgi:hypothetical protein